MEGQREDGSVAPAGIFHLFNTPTRVTPNGNVVHGATRYLFLGERLRRELSIMPFWSNPRALSDLIKYFYVV